MGRNAQDALPTKVGIAAIKARWGHIGCHSDAVLPRWRRAAAVSGEERVVQLMLADLSTMYGPDLLGTEIPFDPEVDTVVHHFRLPNGQPDITIFHVDGSVSVIEVKDGSAGVSRVLAGIGQVVMYALDMQIRRPKTLVRMALAFSAVAPIVDEVRIAMACEKAGVIPIHLCSTADLMVPVFASLEQLS